MKLSGRAYALIICSVLVASPATRAATISLTPVADALVAAAQPASNYGGGGGLSVAAAGLARGEFQSLLRFDASAAEASFDAAYGPGQWSLQSVTLRLTATNPNNPLFNASAAGQFSADWMLDDSWSEGTGTPGAPTTVGITFGTLPSFLSAADETLGTFAFAGGTSGSATYSLSLPAGFQSDVAGGNLVSLRLFAADAAVSYLFNSRSIGTSTSRPELAITAVPEPTTAMLLLAGFLLPISRRMGRSAELTVRQ